MTVGDSTLTGAQLCRLSLCWLVVLVLYSQPAWSQNIDAVEGTTPASSRNCEEDANRLMNLFDAVMLNHIQCPTRQQLVLDAIAEFQQGKPDFNRRSSSAAISNSPNREALVERLCEVLQTCDPIGSNPSFRFLQKLDVTIQQTKEAKVSEQIAANRYVGIGVAISKKDDGPAIFQTIIPGGTAELAGLKAGDQLLLADGDSMLDIPLSEVIDRLRGPEGSELNITVRSSDGKEERDVTMVRRVVPFKTVAEPVISESGKSATIALDGITASSVHELRQVAAKLDAKVELIAISNRRSGATVDLHHALLLAGGLLGETPFGTITKNDGSTDQFHLSGEPIFGNRIVRILVDNSSDGVWRWIASANTPQPNASDTGLSNREMPPYYYYPDAMRVSPADESIAYHYALIQIPGTDWTARIPVGIFCDPTGKPVAGAAGWNSRMLEKSMPNSTPTVTERP